MFFSVHVRTLESIVYRAWQHSCTCVVCFGLSPFVCVCIRLSDAHCFLDLLGLLLPCDHTNLSAPSSSSLTLSLVLSHSFSLRADEWSPGDEVTVVVTAWSVFFSWGIWEVLYFSRGAAFIKSRSLQMTLSSYYKTNTHPYISITYQ